MQETLRGVRARRALGEECDNGNPNTVEGCDDCSLESSENEPNGAARSDADYFFESRRSNG